MPDYLLFVCHFFIASNCMLNVIVNRYFRNNFIFAKQSTMEKALYNSFVRFLRSGTYTPGDFRCCFIIRLCAHNYTLYGRGLRQGSRIVLHEGEKILLRSGLFTQGRSIHGVLSFSVLCRRLTLSTVLRSYVSKS